MAWYERKGRQSEPAEVMLKPLPVDRARATSAGETDRALVEAVRRRDYRAFQRLFERYYVEMVRYAQTIVREREEAEGLMQELFVKIWRMGDEWNPQDALRPYLFAMAQNHCLSHLRKRRRRERLFREWFSRSSPEPETTPHDLEVEELRRAAREAVAAMPERRRQIYVLSRDHGLAYGEIAALLGISVKTVEAHMGQALKFLRERLAPFRGR